MRLTDVTRPPGPRVLPSTDPRVTIKKMHSKVLPCCKDCIRYTFNFHYAPCNQKIKVQGSVPSPSSFS